MYVHVCTYMYMYMYMCMYVYQQQKSMHKSVLPFPPQLDSSSFFPYLSYGANNDVSGIATLLAVVDVLGRLKKQASDHE